MRNIVILILILIAGVSCDTIARGANSTKSIQEEAVIGKFNRFGDTISLLERGKAKSEGGLTGKYKNLNGGRKILMEDSADGSYSFLVLADTAVYEIGGGSVGVITDFDYDGDHNKLIITEIDGGPVTYEDLEYLELDDTVMSPFEFQSLGPIDWSESETLDWSDGSVDPILGIMTFCNYAPSFYRGPEGKTSGEIMKILEQAGYKKVDTYLSSVSLYDEIDDEYIETPTIIVKYSNGDTTVLCKCRTVEFGGNEIDYNYIPFNIIISENGDMSAMIEEFINDAKEHGFRWDENSDEDIYRPASHIYVACFRVKNEKDAFIDIEFNDYN